MITCWFDGCVAPVNPGGHGGCGVVIEFDDGSEKQRYSEYIGKRPSMTNNVAEYSAVILAMKKLLDFHKQDEILVYGDSNLVINQLSGNWNIKEKKGRPEKPYLPYAKEALLLAKQFSNIKFQWIPREENTEADELSMQCIPHFLPISEQASEKGPAGACATDATL